MSRLVLDSVKGSITYGGSCAFVSIAVDQKRDDLTAGLPVSFDAALSYDTSLWDAITARVRRSRGRLVFTGMNVINQRFGDLTMVATMPPASGGAASYRTLDFTTLGPLWSFPNTDTQRAVYDPCPPLPSPGPAGNPPLAWGNKKVEFYLGLSAATALKETKLYQGLTFQRSNTKDTGIQGQFSCVDTSLLYANVPLCFELQPQSGMRRGEIAKLIAAAVGIDPTTVIVPIGNVVLKPILLSNGSLLPFLADFGRGENWFPYFDEFGHLVIEAIEPKVIPDWTLDASKGDYYVDSVQETLPSSPPTAYYITGSEVVTDDGADETTSVRTDTLAQLYAPQTDKVPPSGAPSYLYADGSYRSIAAQELMLIERVTTTATKRHGIPIRSNVATEQFYDPLAKDPNYDNLPAGTSYNAAFGEKSFHLYETERLILKSEELLESAMDDFGTLQKQVHTVKGWYSPQHALEFFYPTVHKDIVNRTGVAYVYPGPVMRQDTVEQYITTHIDTTSFSYGDDGTIADSVQTSYDWFSPQSRCDIVAIVHPPVPGPNPIVPPPTVVPYTPPIPGPPPQVVPPSKNPPPPPVKTNWSPVISGPTQNGLRFSFDVNFSTAPSIGTVIGTWQFQSAFLVLDGDGTGHWTGPFANPENADSAALMNDTPQTFGDNLTKVGKFHFDLTAATTGFSGSVRPKGFITARLRILASIPSGIQAGNFASTELSFDPWANIPQPQGNNPPPLKAVPPIVVPPGCPLLTVSSGGFVSGGVKISPDTILNFKIGVPFHLQLSASGGTAPYTWDLVQGYGAFPTGITISAGGLISGTPTGWTGPVYAGIVVRVTDVNGCLGYH